MVLLLVWLALGARVPSPIQPKLSADEIARRVQDRDIGRDSRSSMRMKLYDRQGRMRERVLTMAVRRLEQVKGIWTAMDAEMVNGLERGAS